MHRSRKRKEKGADPGSSEGDGGAEFSGTYPAVSVQV